MQLGTHGSWRRARHLGDLPMPVAFDVVQDEHGPSLWREFSDSPFEIHPYVVASLGGGTAKDIEVAGRFDSCFAAAPTTPLFEHDVDRNPVEPGTEPAVAAERPDAFPTPNEHILRQFAGLGRVVGHAEAQRIDSVDVLPVKGLEGVDAAGLHSADQLHDVIGLVWSRGLRAGSR